MARAYKIGYVAAMPESDLELRLIRDEGFVHKLAWGLGGTGVMAGCIGVIVGLVMAFHSTLIACPNGHFTPVGGDPNCYSHPDAGLGTSIAAISLVSTTLVVLVAATLILQGAALRRRV
jgi:hypothetical protein